MSDEDAHIVDPDVDLAVPQQRAELRRAPWTTLGAISAGGVLGSLARYQITVAFPHRPDAFGWATWGINVSGCLLIGVLMVAITEVWRAHRLVRPFLGVGVLGGFTTFSTHVIEAQASLEAGAAGTGLLYLAATLAGALVAVYTGAKLTRLAFRRGGGRS
ncbi:fluoride efflux transporter FluC [Actinomadura livida]|uniref:Fluoride-specific ion channel FluC n=1 Tax=Actinomadura livida TaxID=79909 RepID=A0A7W7IJR1_9ACTN|nr:MULTISPECIES: CrcB family protein [Actinomadura]MBB4778382.1 CrcB protein [Actinomadura catellatispora]GGU24892.1 putative fluoride ion transporter CrcB [Actinomadura livida]